LEDGSETLVTRGLRGAEEIAGSIYHQPAVGRLALVAARQTMQDGVSTCAGNLEYDSVFGTAAAAGRAIQVAGSVEEKTSLRSRPICSTFKRVQDREHALLRQLEHGSTSLAAGLRVWTCQIAPELSHAVQIPCRILDQRPEWLTAIGTDELMQQCERAS